MKRQLIARLPGAVALLLMAACIPDVIVTGRRGGGGGGGGEPILVTYRNNGTGSEQHPGGDSCIELTCQEGYDVTHGGGAWIGNLSGMGITLETSRPTAEDRWTMCGQATDALQWDWFIEAFCANFPVEIVHQPESAHPGDGHACITATCPPGMEIVGGGGDWEAFGSPEKIRFDSSRPSGDNAWTICGTSNEPNHTWSVDAVCAAVDVTVASHTVEQHPGGDQCIFINCAPNEVPVAGGGEWNIPSNATVVRPNANRAYASSQFDPPSGWTICTSAEAAGDHVWTVDVVCIAP